MRQSLSSNNRGLAEARAEARKGGRKGGRVESEFSRRDFVELLHRSRNQGRRHVNFIEFQKEKKKHHTSRHAARSPSPRVLNEPNMNGWVLGGRLGCQTQSKSWATLQLSIFQSFKFSNAHKLSKCQNFKCSNFQIVKLSNFQAFKLSNCQSFKLSNFQTFQTFNLSNVQAFKPSSASNFQMS